MKILSYILVALVTALLIVLPVARRIPKMSRDLAVLELLHMAGAVEKDLDDKQWRLHDQLQGLGHAIEAERDFAMKLFVEQDTMAAEITDIAARYMAAMGLDVLTITDSKDNVLSSGHFPAQAGSVAQNKEGMPEKSAAFISENIKGERKLTYQARSSFKVGDAQFYAIGGFVVDSSFIRTLLPREGMQLLFLGGNELIGAPHVEKMSEIMDHTIIINDRTYLASSVQLQGHALKEAPKLIVVMEQTQKLSLFDLF